MTSIDVIWLNICIMIRIPTPNRAEKESLKVNFEQKERVSKRQIAEYSTAVKSVQNENETFKLKVCLFIQLYIISWVTQKLDWNQRSTVVRLAKNQWPAARKKYAIDKRFGYFQE